MAETTIGQQELALLRHIADRDGSTVGETLEQFGVPRQLARSTIFTMMERLRHKGYLGRRLHNGVYEYRAR
ncbi:MAG: BlaI/MecI/CopY family transcriptional regulator, partial [Vicinamibacterales bacterium]